MFDWDRYGKNNLASLLKGKRNAAREQAFCLSRICAHVFKTNWFFNYSIYLFTSKLHPKRCNVSYLFISIDALHVLAGSSAHHQEHITVHTASGIASQYCCLLLSKMRWNSFHLIHDSSKQQYWLTISEPVCTVLCSWWWAEEPAKTCWASVEMNKSRNLHLVGCNLEVCCDARTYEFYNTYVSISLVSVVWIC